MKRKMCAIVSLILAGVSLFVTETKQDIGAVVGAGVGRNRRVATLKAMREVLESTETETGEKRKSSMTFVENGEASSTITTKDGTQRVTINKVMTVYITEDASYYISKGVSVREYKSDKTVSNFDVHMYISEDNVLVKFNNYSATTKTEAENGEEDEKSYTIIKPSKKGIWIECSTEIMEVLSLVDGVNVATMKMLAQYLDEGTEGEGSKLSRQNDVYTLEEKGNGYTMNLLYDLSKEETPYIELITNSKQTLEGQKVDMASYSQVEFRNIGNTVIKGDIKAEYICEDLEGFKTLFNVKE